jgi:hypothetical protein
MFLTEYLESYDIFYHNTWMKRAIYQDAPKKDWQWAQSTHPDNPTVVKSRLKLDRSCLDLLNILLKTMCNGFITIYTQKNLIPPQQNPDSRSERLRQRSKVHRLDCSFFNYVVKTFNSSSDYRIDRGSIGICKRRSNFSKLSNLRSNSYPDCDFGFKLN